MRFTLRDSDFLIFFITLILSIFCLDLFDPLIDSAVQQKQRLAECEDCATHSTACILS